MLALSRVRTLQMLTLTFLACATHAGVSSTNPAAGTWSWLFPFELTATDSKPETIQHVPGSQQSIAEAQLHDLSHAVDWFPDEHPVMPRIVSDGHDDANACGFCHLPTGNGRPENSSLAGLSADYIKRQLAAFADGSRLAAQPDALPSKLMAATARAITPSETAQAADYFSHLTHASHVDVVETATAGFKAGPFIYVLQPGNEQPIGERIIEAPVDLQRFEQRDPHVRFIAYAPLGSIAAGQVLVSTGGPAGQPCAMCHGVGLKGAIAPPLAGRSPTMIMRQLAAFKVGTRSNAEAAPMRAITRALDNGAMISIAAYAASLQP